MLKGIFELNTKTIVTISIGAALYGIVGLIGVPVGPNTQIRPSIIVLTIFSVYFGPIVGLLSGFLGNMLTDMLAGWGIWWNWELASGIFGLFCGFTYLFKGFDIRFGVCSRFHIIFMCILGILGFLVGYSFAGITDIILMGEPPKKIFFQVIVIFTTNTIVFICLAIPIILSFIHTNRKKTNLTIEE